MPDNALYNDALAITASNTVNLPKLTDAINVGAAGTLAAVLQNDQVVTLTVTAGAVLPLRVKRVNATGTTATGLVALYLI
jgi:hypothetical protein